MHDFKMLDESDRHEMKQLACIAENLMYNERRQRNQVILQNFTQRCFDVIDKISNKYLNGE